MQDLTIPLTLSVASLVSVLIFWLLYRLTRQRRSAGFKIDAVLAPYQKNNVRQVIIPDGLGGLIEIEQLVLLPHGVLVIQTYPISGQLFGAEKIEQWTQLIGGRSYKFSNPLNHLQNIQQSLKMIVPKMPIYTAAIFTEEAHFPKGKPDNVTNMQKLNEDLLPLLNHAPIAEQQLAMMWQVLINIARKDGVALAKGLS